MNTRTALLRDIATRRFDHLPRLILADHLDESGDPSDTLTAEFIRVGVELANGADEHRPAVSCDCTRCKLRRRQTELFDAMAHVDLLRESGFGRVGFNTTISPTEYAGGFPAVFRSWWAGLPMAGLPLAVGRVFLCLPVNFMTVNFSGAWGTVPPRQARQTWQVAVAVTNTTDTRGGRVAATVGPVVGQNCHAAFACEYPIDHASRVPTLVRKAVRRCLTNRTSNGERRATVPGRPPTAAEMMPIVHRAMRRRGRR